MRRGAHAVSQSRAGSPVDRSFRWSRTGSAAIHDTSDSRCVKAASLQSSALSVTEQLYTLELSVLCTTNVWDLLGTRRFWVAARREDDHHRETESTEETVLPFSVPSVSLWSGPSRTRLSCMPWDLCSFRRMLLRGRAFAPETS